MSKEKRLDEEVIYQGEGLDLRRQAVEDEIERLEAILNTLDHTEFGRVKKIVLIIESLRDELSALEDLQVIEGHMALST